MSTEKPVVANHYIFLVNEEYVKEEIAKSDARNVYVLGLKDNNGVVLSFTLDELLAAKGVKPA